MTSEPIFSAETFQNEYLPADTGTVDAIVTVAAAGEPAAQGSAGAGLPAGERAEVIVIDVSGSMAAGRKLPEAKAAAVAALDCIDDGVNFAVVAGTHTAWTVWPDDRRALAPASAAERRAAAHQIERLLAGGGTAIGTWLDLTRTLLTEQKASYRHALLLTDGRNETQTPTELASAIERARGTFQCDCRGVGDDWVVAELRQVSEALLGEVEIVARPEKLAEDFRAVMTASGERSLPDVRLRVWTPKGAEVDVARRVSPPMRDLVPASDPPGSRTVDFPLGGWAPGEERDYHLRISVPPGEVGRERLAGRVMLIQPDGTETAETLIRAVWTDDVELSTRINRHVAHYTGQVELAASIDEGMAALDAGDEDTATVKLAKAAKIAKESGHDDTLKLLNKVVDVSEADDGTVKLRRDASKLDRMTLETRSVRTLRLGKAKGSRAGDEEGDAGAGSGPRPPGKTP